MPWVLYLCVVKSIYNFSFIIIASHITRLNLNMCLFPLVFLSFILWREINIFPKCIMAVSIRIIQENISLETCFLRNATVQVMYVIDLYVFAFVCIVVLQINFWLCICHNKKCLYINHLIFSDKNWGKNRNGTSILRGNHTISYSYYEIKKPMINLYCIWINVN